MGITLVEKKSRKTEVRVFFEKVIIYKFNVCNGDDFFLYSFTLYYIIY